MTEQTHAPHNGRAEPIENRQHPRDDNAQDNVALDFAGARMQNDWSRVSRANSANNESLWLSFTNPFSGMAERYSKSSSSSPVISRDAAESMQLPRHRNELGQIEGENTLSSEHHQLLTGTKSRVEQIFQEKPHDFMAMFEELDRLRKKDGKNFSEDLTEINKHLHEKGLLKGLSVIRDDRNGEHGFAIVATDVANKEHNGHRDKTMVSTSHAPQESAKLRHHYSHMHYRRGHYNGWHHSVEGGGGAHGGFDRHAVGGHVPDGARKELIEKALQLAGLPVTEQNIAAVNKIVQRESGWNPNITNNWDVNARAGHPSTGLMQTIPSTFKAYALPEMNNNIHDPLSNLVAGIRYAEARYGRHGVSGVARVASRSGGY